MHFLKLFIMETFQFINCLLFIEKHGDYFWSLLSAYLYLIPRLVRFQTDIGETDYPD